MGDDYPDAELNFRIACSSSRRSRLTRTARCRLTDRRSSIIRGWPVEPGDMYLEEAEVPPAGTKWRLSDGR
jgi:hypothetical protein